MLSHHAVSLEYLHIINILSIFWGGEEVKGCYVSFFNFLFLTCHSPFAVESINIVVGGGAIFIYCQLFRGSQGHNLLDLQVWLMICCFIILWRCKSVGERYPQNQPKLSIPKSKDSTLLLIYNWNLQSLKYDHQKMNYEPEYHIPARWNFFFS